MAKKNEQSSSAHDTNATPEPATEPSQASVSSPDPELLAELERLRSELEYQRGKVSDLADENAHLSAALESKAAPRVVPAGDGPQGIVVTLMESGDERKDFHPKFRQIRMIDPKSLVVAGQPPALALPIDGDTQKVRIRRIDPAHAAYILTCDPASGGQSVYRLATDEEVAQLEAEQERRRAPAERSRDKDLRNASK